MMSDERCGHSDSTALDDAEAVRNLVLTERSAKDLARWDEMEAAFDEEASVRVSWFQGSGAEFVAASRRRNRAGGTPSFHELGSVRVTLHDDRAVASATCTVHIRGVLDGPSGGVEVDVASRGLLYWRVRRCDRWRIAGLDMIYMRDTIAPADPTRPIPPGVLAGVQTYRPSYRWLSLLLAAKGYQIDGELPGIDRPDLIDAFLVDQERWLFGDERPASAHAASR
jgi:hypothetical protein